MYITRNASPRLPMDTVNYCITIKYGVLHFRWSDVYSVPSDGDAILYGAVPRC